MNEPKTKHLQMIQLSLDRAKAELSRVASDADMKAVRASMSAIIHAARRIEDSLS